MTKKREPLKPDRPIASLAFSDKGKVRLRVEHPPRTQNELEFRIGEKFLGSLSHFNGLVLTNLYSGEGRGDLICSDTKGQLIKIQVVEVVDPIQSILSQRRSMYTDAIASSDCLRLFTGCYLSIVDSGSEPFLPSIRKSNGKACLAELLQFLEEMGREIDTLSVGKLRHRKCKLHSNEIELGLLCERKAPAHESFPCQVHFSGGRAFLPNEHRAFVSDAIRKKVGMYYSKPREKFWLLAYSTDTLRHEDDEDIMLAKNYLTEHRHPFDAVWYLYPYDNRPIGHIVQIWSRDDGKG